MQAIAYYDNLIKVHVHISSLESKEKENDPRENDPNKWFSEKEKRKDPYESMELDKIERDANRPAKEFRESKEHEKSKKRRPLDNWIYCRLGHLHLLLEQFPKGEWESLSKKIFVLVLSCPKVF